MKLKISKAFEKRSLTFSNRDEPKINLNCNVGKCVTRCFHFKVQKRDLLEKLFFRYKKRDSKNFFTGFNDWKLEMWRGRKVFKTKFIIIVLEWWNMDGIKLTITQLPTKKCPKVNRL